MEPAKELEAFSFIRRAKSFKHAFRGISVLIRTQHNVWLHFLAAAITVFLGFYLHVSETEWLALVFAIGFVIVAEAWNTAFEFDIDLIPYTGDNSWVDGKLLEIRKCLESDSIPKPSPECDYCAYRKAARDVQQVKK